MTTEATDFASPAWLLLGATRTAPLGQLVLDHDRLTFQVNEDVVFSVNRPQIERVVFPWYYFSGGMKLWTGGKQYRLSFVKPNGAEVGTSHMLAQAGSVAALGTAVSKFADVATGRTAGKRWRALLAEPSGPQ